MPKTREQKQKIMEELSEDFKKQKSVVFVGYQRLKIKDMNELRKKVKNNDAKLEAVKKTLLNIVAKKGGFDLKENLPGQVALVFGFGDAMKPIKEVYTLSQKNENLKILAGIFEGKFIEGEKVIALAQLPGRKELLARLVGSIASPISGLVNVLQGNLRSLVLVLSNIKK